MNVLKFLFWVFSLFFCFSQSGWAREKISLPLTFRHYYNTKEISAALSLFQKKYSPLVRVRTIGKSLQGRPIEVAILTNPKTGDHTTKPAMYIDGNIHGNELQGTEVCLYTIQYLLSRYGRKKQATTLLDRYAFYFVPTVNPDGREAFLRQPQNPHTSRWNRRPFDNDRDGRVDEDGPDDLDGDGQILMMRLKDPQGRWKIGPDPRIMVRCQPGEKGQYRVYWTEGIDNDGDGKFNEDGPGGVDLNRNFPSHWKPKHLQYGSGEYPFSEPETRAVGRFILSRPNIAAFQDYHNYGQMIIRPPGSGGDSQIPRSDLAIYNILGKRGEAMLPGYRYIPCSTGLYSVSGGFFDWTYFSLGIFSFTNELWNMPRDFNKDGRITEQERLRWIDIMGQKQDFVPWKPFVHPQLGKIELGGWKKMARRIPPIWMLSQMCHRNCLFTLYHAEAMARVKIEKIRVEKLAEKLFLIRVKIINLGLLPTASRLAIQRKKALPDVAILQGKKVVVLAGGIEVGRTKKALPVAKNPRRLILGHLPSSGALWIQWIVRGEARVTIKVLSQKGGISRKEVELK